MFMKRLWSSWITMDKKESWRVIRRLHQSEWLQLCKQSIAVGKGVCYF